MINKIKVDSMMGLYCIKNFCYCVCEFCGLIFFLSDFG